MTSNLNLSSFSNLTLKLLFELEGYLVQYSKKVNKVVFKPGHSDILLCLQSQVSKPGSGHLVMSG